MTQPVVQIEQRTRRFPLVVVAAAITGLEGVLALIIAQRNLPVADFVPLGQLWTIWAVTAASVTYAFQQWAASHDVRISDILSVSGRSSVGMAMLAISGVVLLSTIIAGERLSSTPSMWWPIFAAVIPFGTMATGITRGHLARLGSRRRLAFVIAGENGIRLAGTIILVALDASATWYGVVLLAGFLIALTPPGDRRPHGGPTRLSAPSQLLAAGLVGLCSHAFLFGSPIVLALAGGSPENVARLFLVLASTRAPFILLQGIVPQFAAAVASDPPRISRRQLQQLLTMVCTVGAAAAFLVGAVLGDPIVGRVFDLLGEVDAVVYGLIAASSLISACLLLCAVVIVADGHLGRLALTWTLPILGTVVLAALQVLDTLPAMAIWLLVGHSMVAASLLPALRGRRVSPQLSS